MKRVIHQARAYQGREAPGGKPPERQVGLASAAPYLGVSPERGVEEKEGQNVSQDGCGYDPREVFHVHNRISPDVAVQPYTTKEVA